MIKVLASLIIVAAFSCIAAEPAQKPRIAVFDFTTIDILGQKFYEYEEKKYEQKPLNSLTESDRTNMDDRMLGFVKMLEISEEMELRAEERNQINQENRRRLKRRTALADSLLTNDRRPIIIGSEYMIAALQEHGRFDVVDRQNIAKALQEIEFGKSGMADPDTVAEFGRVAGATHILYATVADMKTRENRFTGHGVKTNNVEYSLDLIVKVVELNSQRIVFSGTFTGKDREFKTESRQVINRERFSDLMKDAVNNAAKTLAKKGLSANDTEDDK